MDNFRKIIWLYWNSGEESMPELQRTCLFTWKKHNPGWDITIIDDNNIFLYIPEIDSLLNLPNITNQAKSDIIRLNILKKYGGVWADTTMLCLQPLDFWFQSTIDKSEIFMYHGHGAFMPLAKGPASWFIIARSESYLISKWAEKSNTFIAKNHSNYPYFWMDICFKELYNSDKTFKRIWDKSKYLYADAFGQSHTLCYFGGPSGLSRALKYKLYNQPPYVLKTWSHMDQYEFNSNMGFAIHLAKRNNKRYHHKAMFKSILRFNVRMILPWHKKDSYRILNIFLEKIIVGMFVCKNKISFGKNG